MSLTLTRNGCGSKIGKSKKKKKKKNAQKVIAKSPV